jgi:hypothetical protein
MTPVFCFLLGVLPFGEAAPGAKWTNPPGHALGGSASKGTPPPASCPARPPGSC